MDIVFYYKICNKKFTVIFADMKYLALIFSLASCLFFASCKKSSVSPSKKKSSDSTTTTNSTYYFRGAVNGSSLNWQVNSTTNYGIGTSSEGSNDQGIYTGGISTSIGSANGGSQNFWVTFRTYQVNYGTDNDADLAAYFNSFVTTGTWNFLTVDEFTAGTKTINIEYTDSSGNDYNSIGPQTGNSITISSVTSTTDGSGLPGSQKIKLAIKSCILYATDGSGKTATLTNVDATVRLDNMLGQ